MGKRISDIPTSFSPEVELTAGKIIKLAKQKKTRDLLVDLKLQNEQLTKKDIAKWRLAWQMALNVENPKRTELYRIYRDNIADLHTYGAIRNRKLKTLSKPLKIADKEGKNMPELTLLFRSKWFKKFCSIVLDTPFWAHSLVQFEDIVNDTVKLKFSDITLIPRQHVCPEFGTLLREPGDDAASGIYYREMMDWCIEIGEKYDLGILNILTPQIIAKRNAMAYWDQFAEVFGMPVRIWKTTSRNEGEISKVYNMLVKMGAASFGVFPEGTEIEIVESSKGDAFNVYDRRIERANTEISKAILGQTMTMDNGSSKSQALVHENVTEDIMWSDSDYLLDVINDDLIPLMIRHGMMPAGYTAEYDDTYEFSQTEMQQVEAMLISEYDIDPAYFIDKYNIQILGKKQTKQTPPTESIPVKKADPAKKKS